MTIDNDGNIGYYEKIDGVYVVSIGCLKDKWLRDYS